jgi:hypothetical protein
MKHFLEVDYEVILLPNGWILVLVKPILHQNYERRSMWSFDQAKIALTLVQEWPYKTEVTDLCNNKKLKKLAHQECCILNPPQQILPQKVIILFVIKFRRNF